MKIYTPIFDIIKVLGILVSNIDFGFIWTHLGIGKYKVMKSLTIS